MTSSRPKTPTRWSISGRDSEQRLPLPLGQAAGDDHAAQLAAALELEHFVDRGERFLPGRLDEPAGVDDDEIGPARVVHQLVAVELQQAEHPLAIDEVLRAAEADERVAAFGRAARKLIGESVYHVQEKPERKLARMRSEPRTTACAQ